MGTESVGRAGRTRPHSAVPSRAVRVAAALAVPLLGACFSAPALAQADAGVATAPAADAAATGTYTVSGVSVAYAPGGARPVPEAEVLNTTRVRLVPLPGGGFDAAAPGAGKLYSLRDLASATAETAGGPKPFSAAAVQRVQAAVQAYFNGRGIYAVTVDTDPKSPSAAPTALTFLVTVGRVTEVRTVAAGDRITDPPRENNPAHAFVLENSPIKSPYARTPTGATRPANRADLRGSTDYLDKPKLDDYVLFLNRHPGRRVDVALSPAVPADEPVVALDYLVTESKPWQVLAQVSNTGTRDTNEWRERFSFSHNQLTGRDDIFSAEYNTAGFEDSHAVTLSYDFPISQSRKVRARVYGLYSEFVASDVGFAGQDFLGNELLGGAEVTWTVKQWRETFLDVFGGVKVQRVEVRNRINFDEDSGDATFISPYVGARISRTTDVNSLAASAALVFGDSDNGQDDLDKLRVNADRKFALLQFEAGYTTYLEPLLNPARFARGEGTLAQELSLSVRGQYSFNDRLVPQNEETAGGLYTVRGYEESATAGDTVVLGSAEYRIHYPRTLKVRDKQEYLFGKPFRYAPQSAFGTTDWDLIGRVFVDAAQTVNHERLVFEHNNTLVGVGLGVEFLYKDRVGVRVDWGVALTETRGGSNAAEPGDNRFHFVFTAAY
jgi:hemolysin activation/secretion protein